MAHHRQLSDIGGGQALSEFASTAMDHSTGRHEMHAPMELNLPTLTGEEGDEDYEDEDDDEEEGGLLSCADIYQQDQLSGLYPPQTHRHNQQEQKHQRQHHHHRLPDQGAPTRTRRGQESVDDSGIGPSSVVGQEGMPLPAPPPRGPKLKFTSEDDSLLVFLKESKSLTWKQIADFFPGRSSGTLQVRYCTKLKAKTMQWTDDTESKLRRAVLEYEQDRWRIVAAKVGSGFTPAACKEKAQEIL